MREFWSYRGRPSLPLAHRVLAGDHVPVLAGSHARCAGPQVVSLIGSKNELADGELSLGQRWSAGFRLRPVTATTRSAQPARSIRLIAMLMIAPPIPERSRPSLLIAAQAREIAMCSE